MKIEINEDNMLDRKIDFQGLRYVPEQDYLITENSDGESRNKLLDVLLRDLKSGALTVKGANFRDFLEKQEELAPAEKNLLLQGSYSDKKLAEELVQEFFAAHQISKEEVEKIATHWNQNVAGSFVKSAMLINALILNKNIAINRFNADLTIVNKKIMITVTQEEFELQDQWNDQVSPQPIFASSFNEKNETQKISSKVVSQLELTDKGFKLNEINFSDHIVKSFYSDYLKNLPKQKNKNWLEEFNEVRLLEQACQNLLDTTNKNPSKPLCSAGRDVLNAVSQFREKNKTINVDDLKKLNAYVTETNKIINNATMNKIVNHDDSLKQYSQSVNEVMGMDRNKWEVIGKAMIGVVGAVLLTASIAALIVLTSGAALPVIIAGLALGIKIGVIAGTATAGSAAVFGGAFFTKNAHDGAMNCAGKKVLNAAKDEIAHPCHRFTRV